MKATKVERINYFEIISGARLCRFRRSTLCGAYSSIASLKKA